MIENKLVTLSVGHIRVGLPASCVDQAVFACEITALPNAPAIVLGVIDVRGTLAPVFDMNARFGLPSRGAQLDNYFIICNTPRRKVVLLVDKVHDVIPYDPASLTPSDTVLPGLEYIKGIARLPGDMILVQDLPKFLSADEEQTLQTAMEQHNA